MNVIKSLLLLLALTLTACLPTGPLQPTTPADDQQSSLTDTEWYLESFGEPGTESPVIDGSTITLKFEGNRQVTGQSGCNGYGGSYAVQPGTLSFGQITSTLVACEDPEVNDQEQQYLTALRAAGRFNVSDDRLVIWYENDRRVLNFARASASTPGPAPTDAAEPTADPIPGKDDGARIELSPGQTSAEIFAEIAAGTTDSYIVYGQQGQTLTAEISSPNNDVLLSVTGEDGTPLKRYQNGPPSWTAQLPATQDYVLQAVSVGQATSYSLKVSMEPLASSGQERVVFEAGATSASRSGNMSAGETREYVLSAAAGERMHTQTVGYSAPVQFTLYGPDGHAWSGEPGASDVYIFTKEVLLPEDGDYVVRLSVPPGEQGTRFDVVFSIDSNPASTEPPERVEFASGDSMTQRSGLLPSGSALKVYVLSGQTGQEMTVIVTSDDVPLSLMITTPSGVQRIPVTSPAEGAQQISHSFTLVETGDYLVTLNKAEHTPSTNYTIEFVIQ